MDDASPDARVERSTAAAAAGLEVDARATLAGPGGAFALGARFSARAGECVALVGPSGAGKSTLLRFIAGLATPASGRVVVDGTVWRDSARGVDVATRRRSIGFVFQDYLLFPNMTARGNVEYALGGRGRRAEAEALLASVGLDSLGDAYPERLSGGQKQRLALIRALARRPALLLLDEPLSALDPDMRARLQDEIARLRVRFATTTILVSHDVGEILRLADRVVRLDGGRVTFDGPTADAFGLGSAPHGLTMLAEHLDGPDGAGRAAVRVAGAVRRVRYLDTATAIRPGTPVALDIDAATVRSGRV